MSGDVPNLRAYRSQRMDPLAVLERALAPEVVAALDALMAQHAEEAAARHHAVAPGSAVKPWLTVAEAAAMLGCTPTAVRKRHGRGRLEGRYQGRRLYIASDSIVHLSDYAAPDNQAAPATRKRPGARTTKR